MFNSKTSGKCIYLNKRHLCILSNFCGWDGSKFEAKIATFGFQGGLILVDALVWGSLFPWGFAWSKAIEGSLYTLKNPPFSSSEIQVTWQCSLRTKFKVMCSLWFSDIWALGCVLYEMCTLKHAVSRNFVCL